MANIKKLKEQIKIAKKNKFSKNDAVDFLIEDLSLSEQEQILKSRRTEMDEDYEERLENKLRKMPMKRLILEINSLGYKIEDIS
ncbi:hypothetical protein CL617_04945 [archaeon]|nr:hypothetical protein [archaeon]|tara:strand:- start:112 stop:363 length:252 start_codon:yes stop_codon:yes gene_type:complete